MMRVRTTKVFAATVAVILMMKASTGEAGQPVCNTPACESKGAELKASMDTSADPCDNFYQFACGGWKEQHEVPKYTSAYGQFQALDQLVKNNISRDLQNAYGSGDKVREALFKANAACMLGGDFRDRDDEEAWNEIVQAIGVEEWPNGPGDINIPIWSNLLGDLIVTFHLTSIVSIDIKHHPGIGNIIHMRPGSLAVNKKYLGTAQYKDFIYKVVKRISTTSLNEQELETAVDEMVQFEMHLAEIFTMKMTERNENISVSKLAHDVDLVRSMVDIYQILDSTFHPANVTVQRNMHVLVTDTERVRKLLRACGEWERQIVSNALVWNALLTAGMEAMPKLRELHADFKSRARNVTHISQPLTLQCQTILAKLAFGAYSSFYIDGLGNLTSQLVHVKHMVDFQLSMFKKELEDNDWMDEETRKAALLKLSQMTSLVGYPSWINNKAPLAALTPNPKDIRGERFVHYYTAFARLGKTHRLQYLLKPYNPANRAPFDAATVNAYYKWTENKIYIPAGIIQKPFFDADLPEYINYATLGYIVFHEITHGFDSKGRLFDETGTLRDWWTAKTARVFREKAECFVNQYGNITDTVTHTKLPSRHTLAEDISDNAASRQSYLTYLALKKQANDTLPLLPGLETYTTEQLHFISAAQPWCKVYNPNKRKQMMEDDVHSISDYRVNVAFGNTPQFAAAFKCLPGSKMNFAKKCSVW